MAYGELVHTETDAQGIRYELYIHEDDSSVRGNAIASGDDAEDKRVEDELIDRLDSGDVWAWAQTTCRAYYKGVEGFDYLGGCSYKDTADFIQPGGYWDDMKSEARAEMIRSAQDGARVVLELDPESIAKLAR